MSITEKISHAAERKAFETILESMLKKGQTQDVGDLAEQLIDMIQKIHKGTWSDKSYETLRMVAENPDGKWARYTQRIIRENDPYILKTFLTNVAYEGGFRGYQTAQENARKYGINVPWLILMDPTSACNMHCTGCWAAEYGHKQSLSFEEMDRVLTEAKELGTHACLFTGGEPLLRKKDISIEGFEEANDGRRGDGHFQKALDAMDLMRRYRIPFGVSICYTSQNYKVVTSDEFLDLLISKGCVFAWYFHYMPVGVSASTELLPTPEQRAYMKDRVREIRGLTGGKELYCIDFQNDGEFAGGCVAGGRIYCHINAAGDVEPCVFIHYSGANIREKSFLECLQQPLFKLYREGQPFHDNHLRPCPMLENPELLPKMVAESGAHSTDLEAPESAEHLCEKCRAYAECWTPEADKLWAEDHGSC